MSGQQAFQNRAQIGGGPQVAAFVERAARESRPVCEDATACNCAASEECARRRAVIRALRAIHCDGSAELRHDENCAAPPRRTERRAQTLQRLVEAAKTIRELSTLGALVRVRVPTARFENRNARAVRGREEFAGRSGHWGECIERIAPSDAQAHAAALACDFVRSERGLQSAREV